MLIGPLGTNINEILIEIHNIVHDFTTDNKKWFYFEIVI